MQPDTGENARDADRDGGAGDHPDAVARLCQGSNLDLLGVVHVVDDLNLFSRLEVVVPLGSPDDLRALGCPIAHDRMHPPPLVDAFVNHLDNSARRFPRILKRTLHTVVRVQSAEYETESEEDRNEVTASYTGTTLSLVTG